MLTSFSSCTGWTVSLDLHSEAKTVTTKKWRIGDCTPNRLASCQLRSYIFLPYGKRTRETERVKDVMKNVCCEKFNYLIYWKSTEGEQVTKRTNGGYGVRSVLIAVVYFLILLLKTVQMYIFSTRTPNRVLACVLKMRWLTDVTVLITTCLTNRLYIGF